ncbi:hypothetical protein AAG906_036807 [Vitis piasezkii]
MAGGSAMEALRERMTQIEEALGEWPREDGTVASWAEHTMGEVQAEERNWLSSKPRCSPGLMTSRRPYSPMEKTSPSLRRRNAKELENFLWDIEYMYLTGDAKLWWRTRMEDDVESGRPQITTWETLKKELKDQFLPTNMAWVAKEALRRLRHTGSVREYVKEFSSLMLDIKNMSEEDKLFNFMSGLQGWAQTELRRQGVRDLPATMAAADCLVDYKMGGAISTTQRPSRVDEANKKLCGGKPMEKTIKVEQTTRMIGCFIRNGPHRAKDAPKREALTVTADDKETRPDTPPRVNPLQLLNVIHGETPVQKSLMHIHAIVNGVQVKALVDSGATHNFVATKEAAKLGLKLEEDTSRIKAVNSKAQKIQGVAKNVPMQIGDWKEKRPCFVQALRAKDGGKGQPEMLSAIQLKKGLKRIKEGQSMEVPDSVVNILKEFKDVMSAELPKELPPRRPIDHKIELMPGTKAPAQAPYRMSPTELLELRKQLKELLDAGLIQPSRAPYGAPVLFQKKHDGSLRMCVDYRALNKVTIKNKYRSLWSELFDKLSKASYFTKLDTRSGKTTCVTRYCSYEFLVMPFGLTNAPATFCNLMNDVLFDYLDAFVVVYLDDVVVYSKTLTEHEKHLRLVFQRLRENRLYVITEKCEFAQEEITFLGHKIDACPIGMDKGKVEVIAYITALSEVISDFNEKIKQAAEHDVAYGKLKQQVKEGVIRRYWLEGGLRKELLRETHDAKWAGHLGEERTLALLARSYYWPKMGEDVQAYVKSCLVCQLDKTERKKAAGLLQPLPIPEKPWESISMDFITGFPKVRDFKSVFVVVDRFSKYVVFIPAPDACPGGSG